jgi:hypothetical protein
MITLRAENINSKKKPDASTTKKQHPATIKSNIKMNKKIEPYLKRGMVFLFNQTIKIS